MINQLLLTDKEIIEDICGSCFMEEKWSDADCKVCQANMRASNKSQLAKIEKAGVYFRNSDKLYISDWRTRVNS